MTYVNLPIFTMDDVWSEALFPSSIQGAPHNVLWQQFSCNIKKWEQPSLRDCNQKLIANLAQMAGPPAQGSVPAEDSGLGSGSPPTTSVLPEILREKKKP